MFIKNHKLAVIIFAFTIFLSVPHIVYASAKVDGQAETEEENFKAEDNWLTEEVGRQLNKRYDELTKDDFLKITKIDLKNERLKSHIPEDTIGLLQNLQYLNLNYTKLDGDIPDELGKLPNLKYLDLGDNNFSEITENIEKKTIDNFYTYCDIDGNGFRLNEGFHYLKGKLCYYNHAGNRVTGDYKINGQTYQFDEDGFVKNGWEKDDNESFLYYDNGEMEKNKWMFINGKYYYFDQEGKMLKGIQEINGDKYYFSEDGSMLLGWQQIDSEWYYFNDSGKMSYGWIYLGNKTFYFDKTSGKMVTGTDVLIDGQNYSFDNYGHLIKNTWVNDYTYIEPDGTTTYVGGNYTHSATNFNLFKYMTSANNEWSVHYAAIRLHSGITSNNCVYFSSEALRRIGINIPYSTANTYQLENILKNLGFSYSYDLYGLKPGDIVFTAGYTHVYIFMGWDDINTGVAYIVDNQEYENGGNILHRRNILYSTSTTDRATHYFYYAY
ncbi:leucine-rich repeat domain-containing protein [Clostridium sp. BJN0001]|uniref:N-acetylmuramoyl-L-alanine amidase family protein n=1 Tax=Clostridium sp. BJN0001 TaxID=2930219 RepID=UPI001FD18021|nr:leucine-rich repeat domain-containing protein [Clostridium sp. BJN0001]